MSQGIEAASTLAMKLRGASVKFDVSKTEEELSRALEAFTKERMSVVESIVEV